MRLDQNRNRKNLEQEIKDPGVLLIFVSEEDYNPSQGYLGRKQMNFIFLQKTRAIVLFLTIVFFTTVVSDSVYSNPSIFEPTQPERVQNVRILESLWSPSKDERDVFIFVNYHRKKQGLEKLAWSNSLGKMARAYSERMGDEDFFDHYDSEGKSVVDRAEVSKIKDWKKIGENLFFSEGYINSSTLAVKGWLNSPPHRHNMFDAEWTHTGIGMYVKGRKTYVTQVFIMK